MNQRHRKGRSLLVAMVGTAALACGCGSNPAHYADGGVIPGCFCGNGAPTCYFEDAGACAGVLPEDLDAGPDAGATDAGPVDGGSSDGGDGGR